MRGEVRSETNLRTVVTLRGGTLPALDGEGGAEREEAQHGHEPHPVMTVSGLERK